MTSKERVLAIEPDARLFRVNKGAGETYARGIPHYHIWRRLDGERIETLAYVPCYGKSEASAWKAALAHLNAVEKGEAK